jgi:hypothetical protein
MGVVQGILEEELARMERLVAQYQVALSSLPRGSVRVRMRGSRSYLYLASREGQKVQDRYVGPVGSQEASKLESELAARSRYAGLLSQALAELSSLRRLCGRRRSIPA